MPLLNNEKLRFKEIQKNTFIEMQKTKELQIKVFGFCIYEFHLLCFLHKQ